MGGIKNKLDKLSNKTLFKVPLWLKGDVRRKSDRGIVSDTNPLGSRLPSFSQPSEMLTRNTPNTRKPNRWSLYASKTIGSLHLVTLTKYLSIACLSLALISTTGLNLYRTYSSSNIESNAIDSNSEVSTLANDSSSISLSFSNATGSCSDTSNPANVCMSIPDGGGIATGGHTVTIATSTKVDSYNLSLSSTTDSTSLVNDADSNATIPTISSSYPTSQELSNNSWGYSIGSTSSTQPTSYSGLKPVSNPDYLLDSTLSTPEKVNESINVIYGVMVKDPAALRAGNYALALQYTATATIPAPSIASVNPNSYELGSNNDSRITITGQNLDSAYKVYLEGPLDSTGSPSATSKQYDCTNLMGVVDGNYNYQLTCTIPTDQTNPDLEPGDYTIHVVTQGGEGAAGFSYIDPILTINFNNNEGEGSMSPLQIHQGNKQTLPKNTFIRNGYIFNGWNTSADGSGVAYMDGADYEAPLDSGGQTITLYAQWLKAVYMQDLTITECQENATNSPFTVVDKRDNNTYIIRYINGNCWMAQNLRVGSGLTLTSADSNVSTNYTIPFTTLANNSASVTEGQVQDSGNYEIGYWYNYCAATAGTICQTPTTQTASYDICPAGWTLPSYSVAVRLNGSREYAAAFAPVFGGSYGNGRFNADKTGSYAYAYWWTIDSRHDTARIPIVASANTTSGITYMASAMSYMPPLSSGYNIRCILK